MNKEEIYNLLPENLKKYKNLSNATKIFSEHIENSMFKEIKQLHLYTEMNNLNENILDELAWQWYVEFYSSELPKSSKVEMIKKSYLHHIKKGTVGALESALKAVVNRLEVKEWYEYGGDPYTFQLIVDGKMLSEKEIGTVYKLVSIYKNVRSHLDGFIITQKDNIKMNFISGLHEHKKIANKFIEQEE